jgi:hypothetical protein
MRGTGAVHACRTRCWRGLAGSAGAACPPSPRGSLRSAVGQMVFYCRAVCRGSGVVEGFPWPGRRRGRAVLGGRSPGLLLAAAVFRPWKATQGNLRSLLRQGQAPSAPLQSCPSGSLDTRSLRLASRRKDGKKLQRPAAYRPGERSACFSPPPLRRPWEAQLPLRVAAAHSPQKNASEEHCFFRFVALRARRRPS